MNASGPSTNLLGTFATAAVAVLSIGAAGCTEGHASAAPAAQAERTEVVARGAKAEADAYVAEAKPSGTYKIGAEGAIEVTLASKGAYHVNDKYPIKWKAAEPPPDGVTFPKPVLRKEDGVVTQTNASFKVPFVASKAGKTTLVGTLSFSVCSDANCLMDKVELALDVDVL